jgi:hypothetical protein
MNGAIEFGAPWSKTLRRVSTMTCIVLIAMSLVALAAWRTTGANAILACVIVPPLVLLTSALFMVKGYVLTDEHIIVKRLGWETRLPLDGLASVEGDQEAMLRSLRLFGVGGLLSYSGIFWNRKTGRYRAFATDPSRSVVLRYAKRKVVLTPHDPQRFIVRARSALKHREGLKAFAGE